MYAQDVQVVRFSSFFFPFTAIFFRVGVGVAPCRASACVPLNTLYPLLWNIERNNLVEMPLNEQNIFRIPVHMLVHFTCRLFVPRSLFGCCRFSDPFFRREFHYLDKNM